MSSNEERNPYEGVGKAAWEKRQLIQEEYPDNLYKEAYGDRETVLSAEQRQGLLVILSFLEQRQRDVLEMRYRDKFTFSEIGKIIGVTTERVRQIEHKALRGLRYPRYHKIVLNGFDGYIKLLRENNYQKGYDDGYLIGYDRGIGDAGAGVIRPGVSVRIIDLPIEALRISAGTHRCLSDAGFEKIAELLILDEKEVKRIPKLSTKRRQEVAIGIKRYQIRSEVWEFYLPYEQKYDIMKENKK